MKVTYSHIIEIPSSLAVHQRANRILRSRPTENFPISILLKLETIANTVTKDSTIALSHTMLDFCKDSAIMITLYDGLGYIIGKTTLHTTTSVSKWYEMYRYRNAKLKLGDILKHIPADATEADFHVDLEVDSFKTRTSVREDSMAHYFISQMRRIECTAPAVKFQMSPKSESGKILSDATNKDKNDAIVEETQNMDNNVVLCDRYEIESLMNTSEYFMKHIAKTPNEDGQVTVDVKDIDPKMFKIFLEFVYHKKRVCLDTKDAMPLQQCCREMLEIADRFLCPELARDCAECVVQVTSKDTVFADIRFLATHYNGPNKLEIISRMAKKPKELQPENHLEQLHTLCQQLPDVAACFLYRYTIFDN